MDDLSSFCCLKPECPLYGRRDAGNLTACARYGPKQTRLLYCNACKYRFSERKGTPLFDSRLDPQTANAILKHIAEGVGVRKTARLLGVSKDTVVRYSLLAGRHAKSLHDELVAFSPSDP